MRNGQSRYRPDGLGRMNHRGTEDTEGRVKYGPERRVFLLLFLGVLGGSVVSPAAAFRPDGLGRMNHRGTEDTEERE